MHLNPSTLIAGAKILLSTLSLKSGRRLKFHLARLRPIHLAWKAGLHFEGGLRQEPEGREQLVRQKQAASYPTLTECVCLARRLNKEHIG